MQDSRCSIFQACKCVTGLQVRWPSKHGHWLIRATLGASPSESKLTKTLFSALALSGYYSVCFLPFHMTTCYDTSGSERLVDLSKYHKIYQTFTNISLIKRGHGVPTVSYFFGAYLFEKSQLVEKRLLCR